MGDLQGHPYRELATTNPIGYEALESKNDDRELPVSTLQVKWLALNS